jgi:YVTN family beta-propeller protein
VSTIALPGSGTGVAVTPDGTRLYVSNNSGDSLTVINTATNTVVGSIAVGNGPVGVTLSPDGTRAYVANQASHTVTVINTATNTVVTTINVGTGPFGVAVAPDGTRLYVSNGTNGSVSVIDTATNTVLTTLPVGIGPGYLGICGNGNALLAAGSTFVARTSGALACTLTNAPGPVFTGGTLQLAGGSMTIGLPVNVQSSGGIIDTLGGTVTLANTLSGPGTLAVHGSLAFTSAALWLVSINGASSSRVNVTGTASLGGASVAVAGGSLFVNGQKYTILTAAGGVSGTFNPVVGGVANATLSYDANDVFLCIACSRLITPLLPPNAPINPTNVAAAIDAFINAGGTLPAGFQNLYGLTPQQLLIALTQASGEIATGTQQTTFDAMNLFMSLLTDPFVAGRGNGTSPSTGAPGFADENDGASAYAASGKPRTKSERDAYAMFTKAPPAAFEQRWSVWAAGFGGSQTTDGNAFVGSNAVSSRIYGTAVGADYRFSPFTLAGFALAGGGTNFSLANGLGNGRSDLFQAGAFIRHTVGPAYVSAALAYGWQDVTTNRTVTIAGLDLLQARFNANAYSGRVEGGYRFVAPWTGGIGITPYAAGQFTTFDLPAYAEGVIAGTNNFALAYGAKSVTDPRSELGIRADKSFAVQNGVLTLRGRAAWAHDFDPDRTIASTFQSLPGASFVVNGAAQSHDSALTTASAEMKWSNGWSAAATFEGEFSDVTRSYAGKGVVRYVW